MSNWLKSYFKPDVKLPLKVALILEVVWIFLFGCFVFWFQLGSEGAVDIYYLRDGLIKTAFHVTSAFSIASALEKPLGSVQLAPLFFLAMVVFTDMFSVFDSFLNITAAEHGQLLALRGLTVIGLILSIAATVFYIIVIVFQVTDKKTATRKPKQAASYLDKR